MKELSRKQREILERGETVLDVARKMLLQRGYHGLTMARIAEEMEYSKSTIYQHYCCKEEIIVALASRSVEQQRLLVERAATFRGHSRERMVAVGEATSLFAHLHSEDSRIFQLINAEAITQKASDKFLWPLKTSAHRTVSILNGIVRDAIARGDLVLPAQATPEELTYQVWLLGESSKAALSSWLPPSEMGVGDPLSIMLRHGQLVGDAYGWKPLSTEWDYRETQRTVLREIFPGEALLAYGPGWDAD